MTLTEALAELGLQAGADPDTVRRTYLRLIKERKPESDPDGFRRAREAFEIVRGAGEIAFFAAESERRSSAATPPAAEGASPDADGAFAQSEPDPFAAFLHEWRAVPASAGILPRVAIARRAIAALPHDPRPYWLLVNTRSELGTDAEIADALRAGHRGGWIEFLEALLARVPRLATVAEIEEALRGSSATLQLLGAAALAPRDPARATSVVVEFVRAARGQPTGDVPISRLLSVILALHESGAPVYAVAAQSAVTDLLREQGLELALSNGPLGGVWAMARELAALPVEFPLLWRRSFATGTRAGDLESAFYDIVVYARHSRAEVVQWAHEIKNVAPNVHATLKAALAPPRTQKGSRSVAHFWWVAFFVLPAIVRMCASGSTPSIDRELISQAARSRLESPVGMAAAKVPPSVQILRDAGIDLCGADWSGPDRLSCDEVRATVDALGAGECGRAETLMHRIKLELAGHPPTEAERRLFTTYDLASWQACRRSAPAPSESSP